MREFVLRPLRVPKDVHVTRAFYGDAERVRGADVTEKVRSTLAATVLEAGETVDGFVSYYTE